MDITRINERQFNLVLNREGINVDDYYDTTKQYRVFFRRNNRTNSPQGKLRLFYLQSSDMHIGTVFTLKGNTYVVTSQDGIESNVYYTSLAVKCDTSFTFYSTTAGGYITVPFVVASDKYTLARSNSITVTSGSVIVYTGLTDNVLDMTVNSRYEKFGNSYVVGNTFNNNNLYYLYLEQTLNQDDTYALVYNGVVTLNRGLSSTYQLSYTATTNGVPVDNPTLVYTSSNTSLATVSSTGLVTLIGDGEVTITALWTEQDIDCSNVFTIINTQDADTWDILISGDATMKTGYTKVYGFTVTKNDVVQDDIEDIAYELINTENVTFITNSYNSTTHQLTLRVDDETEDDWYKTFTIHATEAAHSCSATRTITVLPYL